MTHYSSNPGFVKVSFYRLTGKWYMDEELNMAPFWDEPIVHEAVRKALVLAKGAELAEGQMDRLIIVVEEPYHKNAHPVMLQPEWVWRMVGEEQDRRYQERRDEEAIQRLARDKGWWSEEGGLESGYDYDQIRAGSYIVDLLRTPEEEGAVDL